MLKLSGCAMAVAVAGLGLVAVGGGLGAAVAGPGLPAAQGPAPASGPPAGAGPGDIPPAMLRLYVDATAVCPGLAWQVLAGIGKVETDHGRAVAVSSAGALGPMQFMPATWAQYGIDADGDGRADVMDPVDAVWSAASMLCADGATRPGGLRPAIWDYNHSDAYVEEVLGWARAYGWRA